VKHKSVPQSLIEKYSIAGPRYTSYPTAVELKPTFGRDQWLAALRDEWSRPAEAWEEQDRPVSLYFHIPFCKTLCFFCACNKVITKNKSLVAPYLEALKREIRFYADHVDTKAPVRQLHWGGGTPNYLSPSEMEELYNAIKGTFPNMAADADISIELDPRTTTKEQLQILKSLGFTRLSMGVQDFDPHVQRTINRIQPYEQTKELADNARVLGFKSVSVDLIYGLPEQSVEGFFATLKQVATIRPDRVALYGYAHVTWLTKAQKSLEKKHLPTPPERVILFNEAADFFTDQGYRYIGMDHFALPTDSMSKAVDQGMLNRNFMGYTTHRGARLLAFGVSSISMLPRAMAQNAKEVNVYQDLVSTYGTAIEKGVPRSLEDQLRGEVIESLLCLGRISTSEVSRRFSISFEEKFASELQELRSFAADGLLEISSDVINLTETGRLFMRNIAMVFDQYLAKRRSEARPVFSQAV